MNFPRALQKIRIDGTNQERMEDFRFIEIKSFEFVKNIEFRRVNFTRALIEGVRPILGQFETIKLIECTFDNFYFYDDMLKYCTRLKSLYVSGREI